MRTLKPLLLSFAVALTVSACGGPSKELQTDQSGSDRMLPSPCACEKLDYHGTGTFTWRQA